MPPLQVLPFCLRQRAESVCPDEQTELIFACPSQDRKSPTASRYLSPVPSVNCSQGDAGVPNVAEVWIAECGLQRRPVEEDLKIIS